MPPAKGKQATKGQKQIALENAQTLRFYSYIGLASCVVYLAVQLILFWQHFSLLPIALYIFSVIVIYGCWFFMKFMSKATYGSTGNLLDAGTDLNMEQGMAEHAKDVILLTAIVQGLSLMSNYFWLFWFLAPGRAFYLLWVNILGPWFFAPPPDNEQNDKKLRKQERKMKKFR